MAVTEDFLAATDTRVKLQDRAGERPLEPQHPESAVRAGGFKPFGFAERKQRLIAQGQA